MSGKPTTTARGYGWTHQQRRARALAAHQDGTICPYYGTLPACPGPMYRDQGLDLDHSTPRALGGQHGDRLAHAKCNRSAGSRLGAALRGMRTQRVPASRDW